MSEPVIDPTDHKIIEVLWDDARRSASEVGRLVGLSPPATKRRIERLERVGLIRGYTVVLNDRFRRDQIEAFIELRFAHGTQVADIDSSMAAIPEVVESFTLAGDPDGLARVRARDLDDLKRIVDRIRRGEPGGPTVLTTRTVIVLGRKRNNWPGQFLDQAL